MTHNYIAVIKLEDMTTKLHTGEKGSYNITI